MSDGSTFLGQQFIQRLGLGGSPGEAVEEESMGVGVVVERGADHFDHDLVGDQLPFIDDSFLRLVPEVSGRLFPRAADRRC